nr:hypothetical protein CFP56_62364 [Quercus suber]
MAVIPGASRNQAPWRKQQKPHGSSQNFFEGTSTKTMSERVLGSTTGRQEKWGDSEASNYASPIANENPCNGEPIFCDENQGMGRVGNEQHAEQLEKGVVGLSFVDHHLHQVSSTRVVSQNVHANQPA